MSLIRLPALPLLFCAALASQPASFSGIAINSATGQPLSGVHLKLFSLNVGGDIMPSYGAMSGRDGHFSVSGVPPGMYVLTCERTGFVHMMKMAGAVPLPSITLKTGARIEDYKLEMTPRAVIAVRVVDEYGDPVPYVNVEATPVSSGSPRPARVYQVPSRTNSLGEVRVSGGPGKFHVKATPEIARNRAPEIRTDGTSEASYGPTWYPSAASADGASAVEVEAGGDVSIEIRLMRQRSLTITGTVSGFPPASNVTVVLSSGDRADRLTPNQSTGITPEGKFGFTNLPPKFYRVTAVLPGGQNLQSQPVDVRPDGSETVDVQLTVAAGAELSGTLEIAGDPPGAPAEKRTVSLISVGFSASQGTATTEADGSFKIGNIFPGRYRVEVQPLPENGYVKTVELDGAAAPEREIDFARTAHGSRLKITLGRDGAQLSGSVLEKDGKPLGNTVAIVILAPDRDHISPNQDGLLKEGGRYSFKGIRPGKYILFAVDAFRSGPANSEEDWKNLAVAAEEIELKAGEKITKDLKVLLKEDVDARTKK